MKDYVKLRQKKCRKCGKTKSSSKFHVRSINHKTKKIYLQSQCKFCVNRMRLEKHHAKLNGPDSDAYRATLQKRRDISKEYYAEYRIEKRYGITLEEKLRLENLQKGKCYICKKKKKLVIDHCHKTGVVRKLLCTQCNSAIGFAGENIKVLQEMIKYLNDNI